MKEDTTIKIYFFFLKVNYQLKTRLQNFNCSNLENNFEISMKQRKNILKNLSFDKIKTIKIV